MTEVALIGGTGLNRLDGMETVAEHALDTPWGSSSHPVLEGDFRGHKLFFLARHGIPHLIAPHRINYRANLWALRELGVRCVVGVNAVGGILDTMAPGRITLPDQIIDYTYDRAHTYYDDGQALEHIDFTEPYSATLRSELLAAAENLHIDCAPTGTYGVTQGPRLETAAEIQRMRREGCDVVGMTGMPEAALAAELGLEYASICLVVNPAAGLSDVPITLEAMQQILDREIAVIGNLLHQWLEAH